MRLNSRLTVLHMSMLAALLVPLKVEGEDSSCEIEVKVPRGTVYEAICGEDLRINCTVEFCSDSPPIVVWYKLGEEKPVPINVDSSSHIRTEWRHSKHHEGFSYLIFQKIFLSDSGVYQCLSGDVLSHSINVLVSESNQSECSTIAVEQTTITTIGEVPETQKTLWPWVYRLVGVLAFVIIVITLCLRPKCGCEGKSGDASDPSHQPSDDDSPVIHIYENDQ